MRLYLRNQVDDELAVRPQRLPQGAAPLAHLRFALGEDLTNEGLERLRQGRVRDVALVLVELAGCEEAARRDEHLVQLVHDGGFADAGITGYEHQFRCALGHDPVEGREQGVDLALPPVQLLRDQQPVRRVVGSQRKRIDAAMRLPFRQAPPKIGLQAGGGLVALLSVLGEELHGDSQTAARGPRRAHQAVSAGARCGSGPTPADRRQQTAECP